MHDNQNKSSTVPVVTMPTRAEAAAALKAERRNAERRQHTRYAVSATLEAVELQSKARFNGRISDLSRGGCYVDTMTALSVGAIVKLRITREGSCFESKAKVMGSAAGMGMSLMFTDTEPAQTEILEKWVRELSGESLPSEPDLPELQAQPGAEPTGASQSDALSELIIELMRTGALSAIKGKAILQKASRR
jgi:hypothetical protein